MSEYDAKTANLNDFRKNINRLVMDSTSSNAEDMETGRALIQMNRVAANEGIKLPVELNILGKILLNLDQIVAVLTPKYDLQSAIRRFMEKTVNKKMHTANLGFGGTEDKSLGVYFATDNDLDDAERFAEKVLKYLWDDAFKLGRKELFND